MRIHHNERCGYDLDQEEEIAMKEFAKFEEKLRQQKGPDATAGTVGKGSLDYVE